MSSVFSRNFDFEFEDLQVETGIETAPAPATMTVLEAEMLADKARKEGYQEGMIAGAAQAVSREKESRSARADEALIAMTERLAAISAQDKQLRADVEQTMAEVIIGIGERVLPDFFEEHLGDVLVTHVQTALQNASGEGRVSICIPPELAEELSPKLDAVLSVCKCDTLDIRTTVDPRVEDGTIQICWKNGFVEYDPALASTEALNILKEALSELRLHAENNPNV